MSDRKFSPDSAVPLPDPVGLAHNGLIVNSANPEHAAEPMTLLFSLTHPAGSQPLIEESVAQGEVAGREELARAYDAVPEEMKRLVAWLEANEFQIVR